MSEEEKKCKHCGARIAFFEGEWWDVTRSGEQCGAEGMQPCVDLRKGEYLEEGDKVVCEKCGYIWEGEKVYCVTPEPTEEGDEDAA